MRKLVCALLILWLVGAPAAAQMLGLGASSSEGRGKGSGKGTGMGFVLTGINLSGTTFTAGSPSGTVVGAISVTATGGVFAGTLTLGGADQASFSLSSSSLPSNLQTNGTPCPVGPCTFNITLQATQASATCGFLNCTQAFVITAGVVGCTNSYDFSQSCNTMYLGMLP